MSATVHGINTVGKAESRFGKAIIILKSYLNYGTIYRFSDINRSGVADYPVSVKVANETGNATLKVEGQLTVSFFIPDSYFQPLIQIGHLSYALTQGIKIISGFTEYLLIGIEGDGSAGTSVFINFS